MPYGIPSFEQFLVHLALILQRDFILHRIGTGLVDVTLSEAKGLAPLGKEILHFAIPDRSRRVQHVRI